MDIRTTAPALEIAPGLLDGMMKFGSSVERLTFAQLVVLATRLDRSLGNSRKSSTKAAAMAETLGQDFLAALTEMEDQLACMFALVEAELERRLGA